MLQRWSKLVIRSAHSQYRIGAHHRPSHVKNNTTATRRFLTKTMADHVAPVQITAAPAAGQSVEHDGKVFTTVKEGSAYILVPPNARTSVDPQNSRPQDGSDAQNVFYNPIQQFNRDLSVLAIKAFGEGMCQRKFQTHDKMNEKKTRKQERKRKRQIDDLNDAGEEEGGVKLPRLGEGSSKTVQSDEFGPEDTSSSAAAVERDAEATTNGDETHEVSDAAAGSAPGLLSSDQGVLVENEPANAETQPDVNTKPKWRPRFRILDALSASGLRALRYASEISFATEVVANDRDKNAVKSIKINVEHNKLSSSIKATTGDALGHMYSVAFPPATSHGPTHVSSKYDVVDLDPYGTAAPFIEAALLALEEGGMLCVTSTDSGVFASCGYSEKTLALYGGMPIKGLHSHEGGLRLLLHSIATTASRHGLAIEPLLSLSIDFYARLFIRVHRSPADVKFLAGKLMVVYSCDHGCGAWTTQFIGRHHKHKDSDTKWKFSIGQAPGTDQHCEHCGSKTHLAGPMWAGPLHNPAFIEKILDDLKYADPEVYQTKARIEGMLDTTLAELVVLGDTMDLREGPLSHKPDEMRDIIPRTPPEAIDHHPFFFIPSALCKVIKAIAPPEAMVKGALRHAGYQATRSHCRPGSIKTDAPWDAIWEIMREWVRQKSPIKEGAVKEDQAGWKILQGIRKDNDVEETNGEANQEAGAEDDSADADVVTEPTNGHVATERPIDVKKMKVVFDEKLGKDKPGKRLVRYQENPKENWGPMRKARGTA